MVHQLAQVGNTTRISPIQQRRKEVIEAGTEAAAFGEVFLIMVVAVVTAALISQIHNGPPTITVHQHSHLIRKSHQRESILRQMIAKTLRSAHGGILTISRLIQKSRTTALRGDLLIDSHRPVRQDKTHPSSASLSSPQNPPRQLPNQKYHKSLTRGRNEDHHPRDCPPIEHLRHLLPLSLPRQDRVTNLRNLLTVLGGMALEWHPGCAR